MNESTINYFKENMIFEKSGESLGKWSRRADISIKRPKRILCVMEDLLSTYEDLEAIKSILTRWPFLAPTYDILRKQYVSHWLTEFMYAHRNGILWMAHRIESRQAMLERYVYDFEKHLENVGFSETISKLNERDFLWAQNKKAWEALDQCNYRIKDVPV